MLLSDLNVKKEKSNKSTKIFSSKTICFILFIALMFTFSAPSYLLNAEKKVTDGNSAEETLTDEKFNDTAISYILIETERSQIMARQNIDTRVDASLLARMMTCYIALGSLSLTDMITAEESSSSFTGGYDISKGKSYSVDNLIKAALIGNADNAAKLLAAQVCKTRQYTSEQFITLMNSNAMQFKMNNTVFANSDGSYNEFQHTTVQDTALFIASAIKDSRFKNVYCSPAVLIWDQIIISNPNNMVAESEANTTAGGTLAAHGNNEKNTFLSSTYLGEVNNSNPERSHSVILVISGAKKETINTLGNLILDDFHNAYKKAAIVNKDDIVDKIPVGESELVLTVGKTYYCMVPVDQISYVQSVSYTYEENYKPESIAAPIKAGTVIGYAQYLLKDGTTFQVSLVAKNSLMSENARIDSFIGFYNKYKGLIIGIAALLVIELIILIYNLYWYIIKKRYERSIKEQQEKTQQE